MQLDLATAEYIGAREQQQDLASALPLATGALLVLADGLGGHESGAEAARIVVTTFKEAGVAGRFKSPTARRQALREVLELANARIAEGVDPVHGHRGMASTVVAAVVSDSELSWVSVGDSHLYLWREGRLHKLNEDHSQAGLMVRSGRYQSSDPEVQAVKSVLVSALTGRKLEMVDLPPSSFRLESGDVLMLASDGLNTLSDGEIEQIVDNVGGHGAIKLSTTLLESVRSRRLERQDNTTVVVARVLQPTRRPQSPDVVDIDDTSEERTQRVMPADDQVAPTNPLPHPTPQPHQAQGEQNAPPVADAAGDLPALFDDKPATPPQAASQSASSSSSDEGTGDGPRQAVLKSQSGRPKPPRVGDELDRDDEELLVLGAAPADPSSHLPGPSHPARPARQAKQSASPAPAADRATLRFGMTRRILLLLILVLLLAGGVAIAAIQPDWLSGVIPGLARSRPSPAVPGAGPAASSKATAAPDRANAPATATTPAAGPVPPGASTEQTPAPAQPAVPPAASTPSTSGPAASGPVTGPAPAASAPTAATDGAAPAAAPGAPRAQGDAPLVEPPRPAAPPAKQNRSP
ncbi:MAG: protein phosphatase 2C domain-containing protein [Hyphomicrobiaceae bacterium]